MSDLSQVRTDPETRRRAELRVLLDGMAAHLGQPHGRQGPDNATLGAVLRVLLMAQTEILSQMEALKRAD